MHTLRLNCVETIQDSAGQPVYEMFVNGVGLAPLG